jgi:hypothetical protein
MYQEPWTPPADDGRGPADDARTPAPYSPPGSGTQPAPYIHEPPPPAPPLPKSPWTSLWIGARAGALFPFGNAYIYGRDFYYEYGESWNGLASSGPLVEADVGVRIARHYIVYGFWERAFMGTGSDATWRTGRPPATPEASADPPYGDQTSATTDFAGVGFRWSSRPDSVGLVLDLGLGYRWFRERWAGGYKMDLKGFGEFRFGFGADIRATRSFTLTPLLMFSTGTFHDRDFTSPVLGQYSIPSYGGSHGTVTLTIGGAFDLASGS